MYLNPILILYHFKLLMALMLRKYTLDQSAEQTGKRGMDETSDSAWSLCLEHPAEGSWGLQKTSRGQAGSPWAQGGGEGSLTCIFGGRDGAGVREQGNTALAEREGIEVGSWCCRRKPLLSSGLSESVSSPSVLAPFFLEQT